jgi:hypothetical protein
VAEVGRCRGHELAGGKHARKGDPEILIATGACGHRPCADESLSLAKTRRVARIVGKELKPEPGSGGAVSREWSCFPRNFHRYW